MYIPLNGNIHRMGMHVGNTSPLEQFLTSKQISTKRVTKGVKKYSNLDAFLSGTICFLWEMKGIA